MEKKTWVCELKTPHLTSMYFFCQFSTMESKYSLNCELFVVWTGDTIWCLLTEPRGVSEQAGVNYLLLWTNPKLDKVEAGILAWSKMNFKYSANWPRIVAVLLRVCISSCDISDPDLTDEVRARPCYTSDTGLMDGRSLCELKWQFGYRFNGWTKFVSAQVTVRIPV